MSSRPALVTSSSQKRGKGIGKVVYKMFFSDGIHFVYIQNHLHRSDTSFFLEDLFQLLSSQPEHSLEVKGILIDLCVN